MRTASPLKKEMTVNELLGARMAMVSSIARPMKNRKENRITSATIRLSDTLAGFLAFDVSRTKH